PRIAAAVIETISALVRVQIKYALNFDGWIQIDEGDAGFHSGNNPSATGKREAADVLRHGVLAGFAADRIEPIEAGFINIAQPKRLIAGIPAWALADQRFRTEHAAHLVHGVVSRSAVWSLRD